MCHRGGAARSGTPEPERVMNGLRIGLDVLFPPDSCRGGHISVNIPLGIECK